MLYRYVSVHQRCFGRFTTSLTHLPLKKPSRPYAQTTSKPNLPAWPTRRKIGLRALKIANFIFAVHLFATYAARPSYMWGPSMLPTFSGTDEIVLEWMLTYRLSLNSLARGDIITLDSPIAPGRLICKRIIGLPGDTICVDPTGQLAPSTEHVIIPKGHIWISGDNAEASRDSRMYGPVPVDLVKGRIVARIWPPRKWAAFPSGGGMTDLGSSSQ
ncbi:peptidase S24/S26A/S26B/S26C [Crepidotus variabilis]|uniref:Peptidase S24/S26A/S26B/S26C n=1 Tax=Crepidotus variabilis TaxID=179855 RepID=A0A9P6EUV7_9AGAR|nr:peptidase S24/S26A/S26B/S26C [Crepidotus variabilis]